MYKISVKPEKRVVTGLVVAGAMLASVSAATYPAPVYQGPLSQSSLPSGFSAFDPPVDSAVPAVNTPEIAEWTKINAPEDTMALTGSGLSSFSGTEEGRDTRFIFFGQSGSTAVEADGSIVRLDGMQAAVTLPATLPADQMYLLWPRNDQGYGRPVAINKTEAWWVGPDKVAAGESFSVYGRNLQLGSGSCDLYIEELNRWFSSSAANPYKADFVLPADIANGTYTVWAHNGCGGKYGWSKSLKLTVYSKPNWSSGSTINVTAAPYNAKGDGSSDDRAAIQAALTAAKSGDTVYLPAGTYLVSGKLVVGSNKRLSGAGMDQTVIKSHSGMELQQSYSAILQGSMRGGEVRDLTVGSGNYVPSSARVVSIGGSSDVLFENVRMTQQEAPNPSILNSVLDLQNSENVVFRGCKFVVSRNVYLGVARQIFFDGCDFYGINDNNSLFGAQGSEISIFSCTAQPLDDSDPTDGSGWGKGRWVAGSCPRLWYFGGNRTFDMCPRYDPHFGKYSQPVDQNSGEQFMFEGLYTKYRGQPVSSSASGVVLSGLTSDFTGQTIVVVEGRGQGQSRRIISYESSSGALTLNEPWTVQPDTQSVVMIGRYGYRVVAYANELDGADRAYDPAGYTNAGSPSYTNYTATAGVSFYGGFLDSIVADNTCTRMRTGVYSWSLAKEIVENSGELLWQPNFYNQFIDNSIDRCLYGISSTAAVFDDLPVPYDDTAIMGAVWRRNQLSNITGVAFNNSSKAGANGVNLNIFDQNVAAEFNASINHAGILKNQLWIRNTITSQNGGTAIAFSSDQTASLRGNTWVGFDQPYGTTVQQPVLEVPKRVVMLAGSSSSASVAVHNDGTAPMTWQASSDSEWLAVSQETTSIADENMAGEIVLQANAALVPVSDPTAIVTVTSADGQTRQLTVVYEASATEPLPPDSPPPALLTGIAISGASSVNEGETAQYTCTAFYSDGSSATVTPTWSDDSSAAAINASGVLSAASVDADQTVTITASFNGRTATKAVSIIDVAPTLTGISISGVSVLDEQSTAQYLCTASYSDGTSVTVVPSWSENSGYASINAAGLLTAGNVTADQNVTLSASFEGMTDTHLVTIKYVAPVLTGLSILGASSVDEEISAQFVCMASYSDGTSGQVTPVWSENSSYATISTGGLLSAGDVASDTTVSITASLDGQTATSIVTILYVEPPVTVTGLTISGPDEIEENSTAGYTCTASYSDGTSAVVTPAWSEDAPFASISISGVLNAGNIDADSSVTVTASFEGVTATSTVAVWMIGTQVVFPLSGFEGKTVWARLWDETAQEWHDLGEMVNPSELIVENVNPDGWYWVSIKQLDDSTGEWVKVHSNWINM